MKVYAFSGLGADGRLFEKIVVPAGLELVPMDWLHPGKSKTLADYAGLYKETYPFEEPGILMGVSLGGMLAQELSALGVGQGLILISTVVSRCEMPVLIRVAGTLHLSRLANKNLLMKLANFGDRFTIKSRKGRALFYDMLRDADPSLMTFGSRAITEWKGTESSLPTLRVHGTNDRVFPPHRIGAHISIPNGNHFMAYEYAEAINPVLAEFLDGFESRETIDNQEIQH